MAKIKPLTVNGVELKAPKTFDPTYKDIDSSNSYTTIAQTAIIRMTCFLLESLYHC